MCAFLPLIPSRVWKDTISGLTSYLCSSSSHLWKKKTVLLRVGSVSEAEICDNPDIGNDSTYTKNMSLFAQTSRPSVEFISCSSKVDNLCFPIFVFIKVTHAKT
jgi:hypothetical protein